MDKIENYYMLALNAYESGNNNEAELYCNKIIENDYSHAKAWMLKGITIAWQSSVSNFRLKEAMVYFLKAAELSETNLKYNSNEINILIQKETKEVSEALIDLRLSRLEKYFDEEETLGLVDDVERIFEIYNNYSSNTNGLFSKSMFEIISKIVNSISETLWTKNLDDYNNCFVNGTNTIDERRPNSNEWQDAKNRIEYLSLLSLQLVLWRIQARNKSIKEFNSYTAEDKLYDKKFEKNRYSDIMHIKKTKLDLKGYTAYVKQQYKSGFSYDTIERLYWQETHKLTEQEKQEIRNQIIEYELKCKDLENEINQIEEAEKNRIYWEENPALKQELEEKREQLVGKINDLQSNLENMFFYKQAEKLKKEIKKLENEYKNTGLLKFKKLSELQKNIIKLKKQLKDSEEKIEKEAYELEGNINNFISELVEINDKLATAE